MEDEVKTIRDELKMLKNQVARLTDQVTDQIEINQFLRKVNLELDEEKKCVCGNGENESKG